MHINEITKENDVKAIELLELKNSYFLVICKYISCVVYYKKEKFIR